MSDDPTAGLLAAEEAATELLADLVRLKEQVESYAAAGRSLEEARAAVGELVKRLARVAEQNAAVVSAIGKIGTAEIIAAAERTSEAVREAAESSARLAAEHLEQSQARQAQLGERIASDLAGVAALIRQSHTQFTERIAAQSKQFVGRVRGLRSLVAVSLLLSLFACLASGAVLFMMWNGGAQP